MPATVLASLARPAAKITGGRLGLIVAVAGAAVLTLATALILSRLSEASHARIDAPISEMLPDLWPERAEAGADSTAETGSGGVPNAIDEAEAAPPYKPEQ